MTAATQDVAPDTRGCRVQPLVRLRLGKWERKILLGLPPVNPAHLVPLCDFLPSERVVMSAATRALRKLAGTGLVQFVRSTPRARYSPSAWSGEQQTYLAAYGLTPLGITVVDTFRHELENGKRIRWSKLQKGQAA